MNTLTRTQPPQLAPSHPGGNPGRGLALAFLVALTLHGLALLAVMLYRLAPPAPPGEQVITVDLSPIAAEAPTQTPAEQQASEAAPPEVKPEEAPPEVAEAKPEEAPVEPPDEAQVVEPQNQVITSTAEQAEPLAPPPEVAAIEEPKPKEPEKPKPDLAKLRAEREAKLRKLREERGREEARKERLEEIREAKAKAAREAKAKAARAQDGAEARNAASASRQSQAGRAAAGSDPSALRQWTGAISAAIHGRMNPGAAAGTSGGTAMVRFTVSRSGAVSGAGLARSSGVGQIDSAALGAVRGGMPPAPAGVTQSSLSITIPLSYRVR